jgi:hypothetical protein
MGIHLRRKKVSELYSKRWNEMEIAEHLGVNVSTVSRDLTALRMIWLECQIDNINLAKLRELADLETMEKICIERLDKLASHPHQGTRWMEERRKIKERRAKLLGLDAEQKMNITKSIEIINKDQRDAAIKAAQVTFSGINLINPQHEIRRIEEFNEQMGDVELVQKNHERRPGVSDTFFFFQKDEVEAAERNLKEIDEDL